MTDQFTFVTIQISWIKVKNDSVDWWYKNSIECQNVCVISISAIGKQNYISK